MQNVPKIVADRLRVAPPAVNHPDAEMLTAFAERSLPATERDIVFEHLARCGDCRDIVALALPASNPVQEVVRPAPRGWLTWPVLRWGFVAAGIVAVASFGVLQYQSHTRPQAVAYYKAASRPEDTAKVAKNQAPPMPAAPEPGTNLDKATVPHAAIAAGQAGKAEPDVAAGSKEFDRFDQYSRPQPPETRARKGGGASLGGPLPHGPKVQFQSPNSFQYNNAVQNNTVNGQNAPAPPPYAKQAPNAGMTAGAPAPNTTQTVDVQGQNVAADMQNQEALSLPSKAMPLQPSEGGQDQTVVRYKDPSLVVVTNEKVVASAAPPPPSPLGVRAPSASWTISSGALQRSFDQGKTWQNVDINSAARSAAGAAPPAVAMPALAKAESKKDVAAKPAAMPPVFRAVAANGADVWAGGSSGLLYHSTDSGTRWARIRPFSSGAALTGDIVSLDFPDPQHGKITTSTPEVWLTSDAGQTWQKQ